MLNLNKIWFWIHSCNPANEMFVVSVRNFIFRIYSDRLNESFLIERKLVLVLLVGILSFKRTSKLPWRNDLSGVHPQTSAALKLATLSAGKGLAPAPRGCDPPEKLHREAAVPATLPHARPEAGQVRVALSSSSALLGFQTPNWNACHCWLSWQTTGSCAEAWEGIAAFYV